MVNKCFQPIVVSVTKLFLLINIDLMTFQMILIISCHQFLLIYFIRFVVI